MAKSRRKRKVKLPRAPLPRQTGGAHRTPRNQPERKRKYRTNYHMMED